MAFSVTVHSVHGNKPSEGRLYYAQVFFTLFGIALRKEHSQRGELRAAVWFVTQKTRENFS